MSHVFVVTSSWHQRDAAGITMATPHAVVDVFTDRERARGAARRLQADRPGALFRVWTANLDEFKKEEKHGNKKRNN